MVVMASRSYGGELQVEEEILRRRGVVEAVEVDLSDWWFVRWLMLAVQILWNYGGGGGQRQKDRGWWGFKYGLEEVGGGREVVEGEGVCSYHGY